MSVTTIQFELRIGGVLVDATAGTVVLANPAATFGVRRTDTLAVVVAAGTTLAHLSTGRYAYTFTDPADNLAYNYYVQWEYLGSRYNVEQNISGGTGGGTAPETVPDALPRSCISLARYAQLTGYSECALMGVNNPSDADGDCENPIWTQFQRDMVIHYLAEAQEEIEHVTGYPLCPTYFEDEQHPYAFLIHAKWAKVIAAGVRAETDILAAALIDYTVEPALIGPIATTITDTDEVKVFYPGSEREIEPSKVQISGGDVRIWIPRCRLVAPDLFDTPQGGLEYADLTNFLSVADVKRVYLDSSTNATLVYAHRKSANCCGGCECANCGEYTVDACLYLRNANTGAFDALRANYSGGAWTATCPRCYGSRPDFVRVNYLAGLDPISLQAENAVLRLAHSKMPYSPCGCDVLRSMWARDTKVPEVLSAERLNCNFGLSDGAWVAWRFAHAIRTLRAGVI